MKINGKDARVKSMPKVDSLSIDNNTLEDLLKGGIITAAVASSLLFAPVPVGATGWKANSPDEIASRIDYDNHSLVFESGDTIWNLGEALNVKDPMSLLDYNNFKPGDEYYLPVGTIIYWDQGHVIVENPDGEILLDKPVEQIEKINPNAPVSLEYDTYASPKTDVENNKTQMLNNNQSHTQPSIEQGVNEKTVEEEAANIKIEQLQDKKNVIINEINRLEHEVQQLKAELIDLKNGEVTDDILVDKKDEIELLKQALRLEKQEVLNSNKSKLEQLQIEEQELLNQLNSEKEIYGNLLNQNYELDAQEAVIKQASQQNHSENISEDHLLEELSKRRQDLIKTIKQKEIDIANIEENYLAKQAMIVVVKDNIHDSENKIEDIKEQMDQLTVEYQEYKNNVDIHLVNDLKHRIENKEGIILRLKQKLMSIEQELNYLLLLYRPNDMISKHNNVNNPLIIDESHNIVESGNDVVEDTLDNNEQVSDVVDNNTDSLEEHTDVSNNSHNDDVVTDNNINNDEEAIKLLTEEVILDKINQLFEEKKINRRQYIQTFQQIKESDSIEEKNELYNRIQEIARANGKEPYNISKKVFIELLNEYRQKNQLTQLKLDATLTAAAEIRSKEIIHQFSHHRPDGSLFNTSVDHALQLNSSLSSNVKAYGENIAVAYTFDDNGVEIAEYLFDAWQNSPDHDKNLKTHRDTRVGFAYSKGLDGNYYAVLLFGS